MGKDTSESGQVGNAFTSRQLEFEFQRSERATGGTDFISIPPVQSVHFRSESCEWATPVDFFNSLNEEFGFELDVCATPQNAKCASYYTKDEDGLLQPWEGVCWCNPPYGREIRHWVEKAMRTAEEGKGTVVCLVPARTDTKWWHDFVAKASEVRFVKGRLKFGGHANSAPFPSAVVVFRAHSR